MRSRVKNFFKQAPDVDAVALVNSESPHVDLSFYYLTDLVEGGIFEGNACVALPNGKVHVATNSLEEQSARRAKDATISVYASRKEREDIVRKALGGAKRVGFHGREITYVAWESLKRSLPKGAKLVDVSEPMLRARLFKDEIEIDRIKKAADIASKVALEIPDFLAAGKTEREHAAELNDRMQRRGASGPSFSTITSFGENAAEPHAFPTDRKLRKGDYALFDFGAWYKMYASDITRTFVFGKATREQREVYDIVREAQQVGFDAIHHGAKAANVHNDVAAVIDKTKYKGRFIHSTGHSVGLAVHDGGRIAAQSD
ncbi:MAG TPA: Xaa-Pro peptidase family protein, partial [Candidatus Thermoplasmatota archaeon]|nr:Xaa-Pro peptidase family protein [Candidatus Thermoplasmatota archaeon]